MSKEYNLSQVHRYIGIHTYIFMEFKNLGGNSKKTYWLAKSKASFGENRVNLRCFLRNEMPLYSYSWQLKTKKKKITFYICFEKDVC